MPKAEKEYDVFVYSVVLVRVKAVKGRSQKEAARKAQEYVESSKLLEREYQPVSDGPSIVRTEIAEENPVGFLVDEAGDPEYDRSRLYKVTSGGNIVLDKGRLSKKKKE